MRPQLDAEATAEELRGRGWGFEVTLTGTGNGWQGTAVRREGLPASVYARGDSRQAVEVALCAAAVALQGEGAVWTIPTNGTPQ